MKKLFKITFMFMVTFMLSFSLVGQSIIDHFGYQGTSFVNNGWYINGELISLSSQQIFNGIYGEHVSSEEQINNILEITYGDLTQQFPSEIRISKKLSDGYTDLSVEISITEIDPTSINSIDLIEYDDNGDTITTYNSINNQKFNISNNTDSLLIVVNVSINTFKTFQFGHIIIYGDLTNIQENITNNFSVYSYNKNLVVKTNEFDDYNLSVYNLNGQEVFNTQMVSGNSEYQLDLPSGLYIVNLIVGQTVVPKKIMLQ